MKTAADRRPPNFASSDDLTRLAVLSVSAPVRVNRTTSSLGGRARILVSAAYDF